jgi:hypothetical protein
MRFGRWKAASAAGVMLSGGLLLVAIPAMTGSFADASGFSAAGCATPTGTGPGMSTPTASPTATASPTPAPCARPTPTPTPMPTWTPARQPPGLTLASSVRNVGYRDRFTVTARLSVRDPGAWVSVYARAAGSRTRRLLKKGPVQNAAGRGDLAVTIAPTYNTTFTVAFGGDASYTAATVATTVDVAARVTQSLASYYKSERYEGTQYRVYHASAQLDDTVKVAPGKHGECVRFEMQTYFQGAWDDDLPSGETATPCGALSKSSAVLGAFSLKDGAGARYRVRALYVHSRTDEANLNSDSSWGYFRVTS